MNYKTFLILLSISMFVGACGEAEGQGDGDDAVDPKDQCAFCTDGKADAFFIKRDSYLAYGVVKLANTASFDVLDDDVRLDVRAVRGIVNQRPFEFVEQIDTVSYVGITAFTRMADYAQKHGYVPYCGDGELQAILERCDDGNTIDGDGCSSECVVEENNITSFFGERADLIKGADIGVTLVEPNGYYLRERSWQYHNLPEAVEAIFERADGIIANQQADDKVSFDELAILSKAPFLDSLFPEERQALRDAWEIMKVNTAPVEKIEYTGGPVQHRVPFTTKITRPGPVVVQPRIPIANVQYEHRRSAVRRLQQLPGCNVDGDINTVDFADLEKGIADYEQVFTPSEYESLKRIKQEEFIDKAAVEDGGDFVIEYDALPTKSQLKGHLGKFDDYEFVYNVELELLYEAHDSSAFDVNLSSIYSFSTLLLHKGTYKGYVCHDIVSCMRPFRHREISFIRLDGTKTRPNHKGIMLMEHWVDGKRIYNRVVDFKSSFLHIDRKKISHNAYAAARPALKDGTPLSFRKNGTVEYRRRRGSVVWRDTYQQFKLAKVATVFNRNMSKYFPNHKDLILDIQAGRYKDQSGVSDVTIDVHDSGAMIAYMDGCALPLGFQQGTLKSDPCDASGRYIKAYVHDGFKFDIYRKSYAVNDDPYVLKLDRSQYVIGQP